MMARLRRGHLATDPVCLQGAGATRRSLRSAVRRPAGGWLLAWALLAAVTLAAATPKRVLVVHSFVSAAPPFTTHSTAFEATLVESMGEPVDLDEVSLDVARYADLAMQEALVEYLQKRMTRWRPDLVVPIGSPAAAFVAQFRDRLYPDIPIIYCGLDRRRLPADALERNATFVGESFDLPVLVEDVLQVAPATTNITVVIGASPLEAAWTEVLRREFAPFTNRVGFTWLNDQSFEGMLQQVSRQPPRSFILLILLLRDALGVTHNADEALQEICKVANAPVNGVFQHQLGLGIVGGRLYQAELDGVEAARIAVRILRGEPASALAPTIIGPLGPRYDGRELRRWNLSERDLPPGSLVLFREPTLWQRYRTWFIAGLSLFGAQSLLIGGLLLNRAQRRRAEASLREAERSAREFGGRLLEAQERERARLARELHDDITQRLARLAIDTGRLAQGSPGDARDESLRSVRDGLVRLSGDVHAMSYRLHPSLLEDLGLVEALRVECERFTQHHGVPCAVQLPSPPPATSRETALGLYRVTQEALRNVARHAGATAAEVTLRPLDEGLQLAVQDNGRGFDRASEQTRTSLGLTSMRERIHLLGGDLDIESAPGHGTTIVAWVPLNRDS